MGRGAAEEGRVRHGMIAIAIAAATVVAVLRAAPAAAQVPPQEALDHLHQLTLVRSQQACDEQGDAASCTRVGRMYRRGIGIKANAKKARALFDKGCAQADPRACVELGEMEALAEGGPADLVAAEKHLQAGCDAGEAQGCGALGDLLTAKVGLPPDDARAFRLYEKACKAGEGRACYGQGRAQVDGRGTAVDVKAGAKALEIACNLDHAQACQDLGDLHRAGTLGERNWLEARLLYQRACTMFLQSACERAAFREERGLIR